MASGEREPHTLAGAYALDAVTDAERAQFDRHLAGCGECQAEIRELRETAARLGAAEARRPRTGARTQVILAAAQVSQLAPEILRHPPAAWRSAGRMPRLLARRRPSGRAGMAGGTPNKPAGRRMALVAVAAVVLAGAGVTGAVMNDTMRQLDHAQHQNHMIAAVLSAPDAVMLTARISTGGTATVVMSHRARALVFSAHGVRRLPAARSYELWLMGPGGVRPAGMVRTGGDGMTGPAVVSGLDTGDRIGMTVEPAGGSARPTSPPVVLIELRNR